MEPNCNFKGYFDENRAKFPELEINEIKQGFGEDLAAAGIADDSVDAVVMTLVLCSVADQVTHFFRVRELPDMMSASEEGVMEKQK